MLHAVRNPIRRREAVDEVWIFVGPARNGALLEVGVIDLDTDPAIIHADQCRPTYNPYI